jgi:uncharacterized membrane protein YbjE (DUF340 family)
MTATQIIFIAVVVLLFIAGLFIASFQDSPKSESGLFLMVLAMCIMLGLTVSSLANFNKCMQIRKLHVTHEIKLK